MIGGTLFGKTRSEARQIIEDIAKRKIGGSSNLGESHIKAWTNNPGSGPLHDAFNTDILQFLRGDEDLFNIVAPTGERQLAHT